MGTRTLDRFAADFEPSVVRDLNWSVMARTLYVAPTSPELAAQVASLRARVRELEAEVTRLRSSDLHAELEVELAFVGANSPATV